MQWPCGVAILQGCSYFRLSLEDVEVTDAPAGLPLSILTAA
jgi:hypothetical protein